MNARYKVDFSTPSIRFAITERNPDLIPIVDTQTPFFFGEVVALCTTKDLAHRIVNLLNAAEPMAAV